jgi:hypothetical protein
MRYRLERWHTIGMAGGLLLLSEIIFSVQESSEGGYEARALGFSIFTEADSVDEPTTMIRGALSCQFDASEKPSVIRLYMNG